MAEGETEDLTLQEEAAPVVSARKLTRDHYAKELAEYEAVYGYKVRNLKKWLQIGRAKAPVDMPPLDEPEKMPAWWKRCMKQKTPERLLQVARAAAKEPEVKEEALVPPVPTTKAPMDSTDDEALHGTGYAAMLARAQHTEFTAWKAWQEALAAKPFSAADEELRRRVYDRASEQARKLLKDRETGLAGDEDWGRWSEIEELVEEHIAVLHQSLRGSPVRVATKLSLPSEIFRRMEELWNGELDRVFEALARNDWRKSLQEDEEFELKEAA